MKSNAIAQSASDYLDGAVQAAERSYHDGDAEGALNVLQKHLADATMPRRAWPIYFAALTKSGRPVDIAQFRAARDETLLPFLLLHRPAADQVALLADLIPSLTDLTTLHLATDLWCARVSALEHAEALDAVDKAGEWLSPNDQSRVMAALDASSKNKSPNSGAMPDPPAQRTTAPSFSLAEPGPQDRGQHGKIGVPLSLSKWLTPLSAWMSVVYHRITTLPLPQNALLVLLIFLFALRQFPALAPRLLHLRTTFERLIQIV